ncbi:TetR family transcriptional regulator [Devosia sp. D6-9]|nr:TetR family transcriptional regulator [Devosia sp. D6-9]
MDVAPDKRERILAAASRLIVRNGLQCSMQAIAEEAGVATGSLYNYFDSKEALVRGVYDRVAQEMTQKVAVPHDPASSHAQRVQHYIERYIDFIWEDADRARLFDYLDNSPLLTFGEAVGIFRPFVDHGREMLALAQQDGVVRAGATNLIASFVRGAIRNTLKRRRLDPSPIRDEEKQGLAAMCWDAIAVHRHP